MRPLIYGGWGQYPHLTDRSASFYDPGYGYLVCMSQYTRTIISALLVEEAYPVVSATLWLLYSFVVLKWPLPTLSLEIISIIRLVDELFGAWFRALKSSHLWRQDLFRLPTPVHVGLTRFWKSCGQTRCFLQFFLLLKGLDSHASINTGRYLRWKLFVLRFVT